MKVFNWSIDDYHQAILTAMKQDYEWYTPEMLKQKDKVTIRSIRELVDDRNSQDTDDIWREDPLHTPEEVVAALCQHIRQKIEWSPGSYLKQLRTYSVPFVSQELAGGWYLEDYRFTKYEGDVFFASVTAGDRSTGSGRTFYIPSRLRKGHTYEEFLDAYFGEIADPASFGLGKAALINDGMLKAFLGFTERKAHPEAEEADLPDMLLYFRNQYCSGDGMAHLKENGLDGDTDRIGKEWQAFREGLPVVAGFAVRDADGRIPCYWGVMTADNVFRDDITFRSWWDHCFRCGYYLAAFEVTPAAPESKITDSWYKRLLPARHYVVADVGNAGPDRYDGIFMDYINRILPEMGYTLSGAILERIDPETGAIRLYFPVEPLAG